VSFTAVDLCISLAGRADAPLCELYEPEKESLLVFPGLLASGTCFGTEFG